MPLFDIFWATVMISLFFAWLILLFKVIADLLRSKDLGGGAKAIWALVLIVVPILGTFVYVLARGDGMVERQIEDAYLTMGGSSAMSDIRSVSSQARMNTQGL